MSTPTGPIVARDRTKLEDRNSTIIPVAWERSGSGSGPLVIGSPFTPAGDSAAVDMARRMLADRGSPVLCVLGSSPPDTLSRLMLEASDVERRVYVLAAPGFGEGQRDSGLRDRLKAQVLVRRTAVPTIPALLDCKRQRAVIWLGSLVHGAPRWVVELDEEQSSDMFRVTLHWFWHHASDEAWTDPSASGLRFQAAQERPFDVPPPRDGAVQLLRRPQNAMPVPAGAICVCGSDSTLAKGSSRAFVRPSGQGLEALAGISAAGCHVFGAIDELPSLWVTETSGMVEWSCGEHLLRLRLTTSQAKSLHDGLSRVQTDARLRCNAALGSMKGKIWLAEAQAEQSPQDQAILDAGQLSCKAIEDVLTVEPADFPIAPPLARSVEYRWICQPPMLPPKASKSSLYRQWEEASHLFESRLQQIGRQLEEAKSDVDQARSRLAKFFAGALGFDRARDTLLAEHRALAQVKLSSIGTDLAIEAVDRIRDLQQRVSEHLQGIERDITHADVERQREEWQRTRDEHASELRSIEAQIGLVRDELGQHEAALKQGKRDGESDADWSARTRKLNDDFRASRATFSKLNGSRSGHVQFVEKPFEPKRKSSPDTKERSSRGFVPGPSLARIQIPVESLPTVGELYEAASERFLMVESWEQLPAARQEAARLKGKMVAPRR
jgi:hypothetical protein